MKAKYLALVLITFFSSQAFSQSKNGLTIGGGKGHASYSLIPNNYPQQIVDMGGKGDVKYEYNFFWAISLE